jgi:two-component system, chemotaxis family, sensor kinase Cph1
LVVRGAPTPAFGQADLSNCEREQIHLAGSIQPHGALLVLREHDCFVVQASDNATEFLNLKKDVLGRSLDEIEGNLAEYIRPHLKEPLHQIPRAVRCQIGNRRTEFDVLVHRPNDGGIVIELEPAGPPVDLSVNVEKAVQTVLLASSLHALCDETARIFKDLTGYDRVMVYRFDDKGHGEVCSERRKLNLEPYLGNRYPSSDIPQIARRLYERNRVRVLVDVGYKPVPLSPRQLPMTGRDLDMSLCFLRSMSPIHVQYLKNMGVAATLVVSIVVGGKLWGLVACHHYEPRFVHFEVRAVCELLAETIATRIAALESFVQARAELSVRRLEQRMIEAISRDGDWRMALFDSSQTLLQPVSATGVALLFEDQVLTTGDVPGTQELRAIALWLDGGDRAPVVSTASLGIDEPKFETIIAVASGVLATPISTSLGEYIIWFRPEQVRTVTWGGDPLKPVLIGDDPSTLSPRRSFAQWHQVVEGTSEPWTLADLTTARLIGETVADVVLQFRSVRMLIAQNQLENVTEQVRLSELPVIVADAAGKILLTNEAFVRLLKTARTTLVSLDDLPALFADPDEVCRRLHDLVAHMRTWRKEVCLHVSPGETKPLLVRADPIYSSPRRALGFVILFTDLTDRKAMEAARRQFQEGIIERQRITTVRLDSKSDLIFQNLLSPIIENAQLAALEITDGVDMARMPAMLESVKASVTRTAELLEQLIWHATRSTDKTP